MASSTRITVLLIALAVAVCALLNPGNFGTIDTTRRWQVARAIRLGEPMVTVEDVKQGFAIPGRDGSPQVWYGIGQSLVLLPIDGLVDRTVLPLLRRGGVDAARQKQAAELAVAFLMQSLLTACVLLLARRILLSFGFPEAVAVAGSLALLFATTCLAYVQDAQENELLLALALAALACLRLWHRDQRGRWLLLAGMACGFAILVRLTSLLETGAFVLFAIAAGGRARRVITWFAPPVFAALLFDRWYQWHRFGELFSTYIGIFGRLNRPPGQPSFPFSYQFWKGFLGAFFSPDKSVLLFDPLLIVVLIVTITNWPAIDRSLRLLLLCLTLLLFGYVTAYARYFDFGGDVAWGDRFVLLPVQLLGLFAVPLLLGAGKRRWLWILVCASVVLQAASTAIVPNVEVLQRIRGFGTAGVLWNRAVNLTEIAAHREDPQRFAGIPLEWRTLSYLPFQLRFRFPNVAAWAIAVWILLLCALPLLLAALWIQARRPSLFDRG